uniref:Gag protein n=1 Tax=Chenopodium quinoa TaxID=63459 RepID=A0A803L1R9_CHEQI
MQIAIGGRGRLNHITANPVSPDDPEYQQWAQRDSMVLSWIIENIDGELVNQFLDYKTARDLWKDIETLLSSGRDELQIYDLNSKAASMKQGTDTIEVYFSKLNTLWKEIDRRMPNPMKCAEDITLFNSFIQRHRLYQFLAGVSDTLDKEKRNILYLDLLPTIDAAYASIRREIARRSIMTGVSSPGQGPSEIGSGLVAQRRSDSSSRREDKTYLKCSHCGGTKHTEEGCFKLIGYPEWWEDLRQRKAATKVPKTGGKANVAIRDTNRRTPIKTHLPPSPTGEQDAQTGRIIGRGIERGGLYYVDETTQQGNALLAHGSPEYQIWILVLRGRLSNDDLSWLIYPEMMDHDPPTQVGNTTDVDTETSVSPSLQSTPMTTTQHPESTSVEVNSEIHEPCTVPTDSVSIPSDNCLNRYELPPRSTRDVPPKRYDLEYEDQRSRYPIERISNENFSNTAVAFNASLYSNTIPRTVEEAFEDEKWRQAMEDEYVALEKNQTWE